MKWNFWAIGVLYQPLKSQIIGNTYCDYDSTCDLNHNTSQKVLANPFFKNLFFILFYSSFSVEDCDLLEVRVHTSSFVYPLERYLAQYMFAELNQITSLSKVFFISFKRRKKTDNLKLFFGFPWFALEYGISEVFSLLLFSFIFFSENVFSQAIELYCVPKL